MNREDYPVMLRTKDVAKILNVKAETVVKWCRENELEYAKIGGLYFVYRDAFFDKLGL